MAMAPAFDTRPPAQPQPIQPAQAQPAQARSWRERWIALRNRIYGSARFQSWASAFPLTRPVARAKTRQLFDLVAGFTYSQILLACVQLKLLDRLEAGPQTHDQLALAMGLSPQATRTLLQAAAALDLVEPCGPDRVALGTMGATLRGSTGVAEMIAHHALFYEDLRDPVALLRGTAGPRALERYWAYATHPTPDQVADESVADYSALMARSQAMIAAQVLAAYDVSRHRRLLDVGGGEGGFLAAAAAAAPRLKLALFDLPAVVARAGTRLAALGLAGRFTGTGGSFRTDALPEGADLISLVRVLHDHDDDVAQALLHKARAALTPGGSLLIAEPMAGTPGGETMGDAYFGFYLMAMGSGRPRRPEELAAMARAAGFTRIRLRPTRNPMLVRVLHCTFDCATNGATVKLS